MKICHLVYSFYLSGAENLVFSMATRLANRYKVIVGSLYEAQDKEESSRIISELEYRGVRTFQVDKRSGSNRVGTLWKLVNILRTEMVDILQTHTLVPNFYGRFAAIMARVPLRVVTLHSVGNDWKDSKGYWMERITRAFATQYVAVSRRSLEGFERTFGADTRLTIIPNGIDVAKFQNNQVDKSAKRRALGLSLSDTVLINVGRIDRAKGQEHLIEAMHLLTRQYPNMKLLIVGDVHSDQDLVQSLRALIERLHLEKTVLLIGSREDIPELLAISDVFVLPSLNEAMSVALLEAMAAGLPVVASRIPGNQDLLEDETDSLLVAPQDPRGITEAVSKLMDNPAYANKLVCAARNKVQDRFSIDTTVNAYVRLYERLCRTRHGLIEPRSTSSGQVQVM